MRLGDIANADAAGAGKPLDGIRVLALEQMQALPYATQLLGRLGAEVIKVESPKGGDMGRSSLPAMTDPDGRQVGATFLRNNLSKQSICIDLKSDEGRRLVLDLAPRFDVVAENFKAGALSRMGLGYEDVAAVHPEVVYLSVSGFGNTTDSPYKDRPAFAAIVEAMSGIYDYAARDDRPPPASPVGALGDISAALFAAIGVLAALRQRDRTGEGQYVDVAMLDALVAMTDIVPNFWSMGLRERAPLILENFRAADGWFVLQVGREPQFEALAQLIGRPDWLTDERLSTRPGWVAHTEDVIRPAIEGWASTRTRQEAAAELAAAGLASGPCLTDEEVVHDPHVAMRDMLVEMPRTDGVEQPVLTPGNPVKLSGVAEGPETRVPWLGEHTDEVLARELGLAPERIAGLREAGVIA
ncbi:CaiB/BaiF CoA transferase family protein [Dermatobacter hominis]|uniref:CaiB/BaiF CoA transferase family protein n=1 Tax=Dermatobacter hominis TaxID=2884263 RepID=UPI001D125E94|nr:CaiB/BaiF CoA-transferase family protein [Dermatobacter hominis]UDY36523.1 CoA transferase [Dermatobacter hominis]